MADSEAGVPPALTPWQTLLHWLDKLALPLVLAVALVLRLYGIDWDGGALYHPDERAILTHTYDLSLPALEQPRRSVQCRREPPEPEVVSLRHAPHLPPQGAAGRPLARH